MSRRTKRYKPRIGIAQRQRPKPRNPALFANIAFDATIARHRSRRRDPREAALLDNAFAGGSIGHCPQCAKVFMSAIPSSTICDIYCSSRCASTYEENLSCQ